MSLCVLYSRARDGGPGPSGDGGVDLASGLPALSIVGLPEMAVKESKDRVRGALLNGRFQFPAGRVTINLAPADLPKEGGRFDLPIALGILGASRQVRTEALASCEFLGELALSAICGRSPASSRLAVAARDAGRTLILPAENAAEAALVSGLDVRPARHLLEVCEHLNGVAPLAAQAAPTETAPPRDGPRPA